MDCFIKFLSFSWQPKQKPKNTKIDLNPENSQ